ncbi:hypothetical protein B0T10DRAFT_496222 [Thelonectria olida]|uniref:BRCT domain-containing protein n=1 Tax=Thelonectria olida TaxID=1576542 RepID=A0A9P8VVC3_9HYPO|nr:hypothetical protein B0T10DRAFT_496222 [Thelonectria olida]
MYDTAVNRCTRDYSTTFCTMAPQNTSMLRFGFWCQIATDDSARRLAEKSRLSPQSWIKPHPDILEPDWLYSCFLIHQIARLKNMAVPANPRLDGYIGLKPVLNAGDGGDLASAHETSSPPSTAPICSLLHRLRTFLATIVDRGNHCFEEKAAACYIGVIFFRTRYFVLGS